MTTIVLPRRIARWRFLSRWSLFAGAVAISAAISGCVGDSGSDPSDPSLAAREVAAAWLDARESNEVLRLCGTYTSEVRDQLESGYGSCVKFYRDFAKPMPKGKFSLAALEVNGETAVAALRPKGKGLDLALSLRRIDGVWKVNLVGP